MILTEINSVNLSDHLKNMKETITNYDFAFFR